MSVIGSYSHILCYQRDHQHHQRNPLFSSFKSVIGCGNNSTWIHGGRRNIVIIRRRNLLKVKAMWPNLSGPSVVEMEAIDDGEHLDRILLQAQQNSQPVIIDWMAAWCRKCIYLKPKLEKLAAEYDTKVKFYYVDVNKVPQTLVKRGNISKMPTIQLWKDGEMKEEVIGSHKGWLVIEEVKEMIQKFV